MKPTSSDEIRTAITHLSLDDVVQIIARVPYAQSLQELVDADLLLLIQASPDTVSLVPAKLYEYLRARRPSLPSRPPQLSQTPRQSAAGQVRQSSSRPAAFCWSRTTWTCSTP